MRFGERIVVNVSIVIVTVAISAAAEPMAHQHASAAQPTSGKFSPEAEAFLAENGEAMSRMMEAMHVPPTGDVDKDFVTMMIPHHQGAIDMARAVLRSSRNEVLRRLAHEIIITQADEIRAMRLAISDDRNSGDFNKTD